MFNGFCSLISSALSAYARAMAIKPTKPSLIITLVKVTKVTLYPPFIGNLCHLKPVVHINYGRLRQQPHWYLCPFKVILLCNLSASKFRNSHNGGCALANCIMRFYCDVGLWPHSDVIVPRRKWPFLDQMAHLIDRLKAAFVAIPYRMRCERVG